MEETDPNAPEDTQAINDTPANPLGQDTKACLLELLRAGVIEAEIKPTLFETARTAREALAQALAPLDLMMRLDEVRGLAFVAVQTDAAGEDDDQWSHPLVHRRRLTLEQSLLIAILRQRFLTHEQEAGMGNTQALVHLDQLLPDLNHFLGDKGSDSQNEQRLRKLLGQLQEHGLVTEVDANEQLRIRPLIVHVANPENLLGLLAAFRAHAGDGS